MAVERYIEEQNDFNENVQQCGKSVLLLFENAFVNESLEFGTLLEGINREQANNYKIVKVDMATKKNLAEKYGVKMLY